MYKPLPDGLTIKESDVQGLGLFATKDFEAEVVLGIVHILDKNFPHGSIRTALGAFYNHSDDPNCKNIKGFWHQKPVKYLITFPPQSLHSAIRPNGDVAFMGRRRSRDVGRRRQSQW